MANIIDRVINSTTDRALVVGNVTGNVDNVFYRQFAWGANWKQIRMGITCAIREYPYASFNRSLGIWWGASSGSRTSVEGYGTDATCVGMSMSRALDIFGYDPYVYYYCSDPISGSFFTPDVSRAQGYYSGTLASSTAHQPGNLAIIPNAGDTNKRRGLYLIEISASSGGANYTVTMCGFASSSVISKNSNKNYTNGDLVAALTASTWPPTIQGSVMDADILSFAYPTVSYSLDTGFINWQGGVPLEIYDWFIYKVG